MWNIDYKCSDSTKTIIINATTGVVTSVNKSDNQTLPIGFELYQNYPDPFNPSTTISFTIPTRSSVSLKIYDMLGKEVATIVSQELPAGTYSRQWNAAKMSSGVYFYRLAGRIVYTNETACAFEIIRPFAACGSADIVGGIDSIIFR